MVKTTISNLLLLSTLLVISGNTPAPVQADSSILTEPNAEPGAADHVTSDDVETVTSAHIGHADSVTHHGEFHTRHRGLVTRHREIVTDHGHSITESDVPARTTAASFITTRAMPAVTTAEPSAHELTMESITNETAASQDANTARQTAAVHPGATTRYSGIHTTAEPSLTTVPLAEGHADVPLSLTEAINKYVKLKVKETIIKTTPLDKSTETCHKPTPCVGCCQRVRVTLGDLDWTGVPEHCKCTPALADSDIYKCVGQCPSHTVPQSHFHSNNDSDVGVPRWRLSCGSCEAENVSTVNVKFQCSLLDGCPRELSADFYSATDCECVSRRCD